MDKFIILNDDIPMTKLRIKWKDIPKDFIIKTKHEKYGYNEFIFKEITKDYMLVLIYNKKEYVIYSGSFLEGKIGGIINKHTKEYKYEIGDLIKNQYRDFIIIDKKKEITKGSRTRTRKLYKYHCNKCGNEDWIREDRLTSTDNLGCNACGKHKKKAILGINTIWDTDRWMCDLGVSEEDAKKYTSHSTTKITVTCPFCGRTKITTPHAINNNNKSIGCICGDDVSYPEKLMISLLETSNVSYIYQYSKKYNNGWSLNYRYDFYLPDYDVIIETHGMQHYQYTGLGSLESCINNDKNKRLTAINNVGEYIMIDCRYSDIEYIRNNILNSKLKDILDLTNIDWNFVEKEAITKNKIKEVCEYYNSHDNISLTKIGEVFGFTRGTIRDYLKKGNKLNWCNYTP